MRGRGRERDEEPEITAQPKTLSEELGTSPEHESGLSIDPEDLGRQFLSDATEQGNYESQRGGAAEELLVQSAPPTDDSLTGPNFETDRTVWENTVSLAMQSGGPDGAIEAAAPALPSEEQGEDDDEAMEVSEGEVDLTESVIQEASLMDQEGDEPGETVAPSSRTDDNHTRAKKRGGHLPKSARPQPRAR